MKKYFLFLVAVILLISCGKNRTPVQMADFALGTVVSVTIYDNDKKDLLPEVFSITQHFENLISRNISGSDICNLNKNSGINKIKVSDDVFTLLELSEKYAVMSDGKFDVTIAPLVNLWGIGTTAAHVPSGTEVEKALSLVDHRKLVLDRDNNSAFLLEKGMAVDLGGIAKGYIADRLCEFLADKDVSGGILDLGGNIVVFGKKPDRSPYRVGIQNPFEDRGNYIGIISIMDGSVVTSGIYERFFEDDGKHYHHIFDTATGYPVDNNLVGVSIVTPVSVTGDALSTAVFALGLEKGMELVESISDVDAVFITETKDIYLSSGLYEKFLLTDNSFVIR